MDGRGPNERRFYFDGARAAGDVGFGRIHIPTTIQTKCIGAKYDAGHRRTDLFGARIGIHSRNAVGVVSTVQTNVSFVRILGGEKTFRDLPLGDTEHGPWNAHVGQADASSR